MSNESFKIKNGLTLVPVSLSTLTSPQDGDLACDSSDNKIKRYSSSLLAWVEVGSSSGGSINFISNPDANSGTVGYLMYKDAAGTTPVDGTGGTTTRITISTSSTAPLVGTNSFIITNSGASSAQGEGVSYDFTVDSAYKAKVLNVSFKYLVNSGTFVAGSSSTNSDLVVYLYDVTNGVLIQPSTYKLYSNSSTISDEFRGSFQTSSNSTSYRLIFHVASTNTSAWSLKVDDIAVSPSNYVYGTPITDWQDFPSTAAGTLIKGTSSNPTYGTVTVNKAQYRRVGSNMEINWQFVQSTGGSDGSGQYLFDISGTNLKIDTSKITASTSANIYARPNSIGLFCGSDTTNAFTGGVGVYSNTQLYAYGNYTGTSQGVATWSAVAAGKFNAQISISLSASVPIQGWSSSVQMSDSADTRVIAAKVAISSNTSITALNPINYAVIVYDTTGSVTTGASWKYTAPVSGYYKIYGTGYVGSGSGSIYLYKNGVQTNYASSTMSSSVLCAIDTSIQLNAGDYIDLRPDSTQTFDGRAIYTNQITIERLSGPASIAATETVAASYYASANASCISQSAANFDSRDYDTHSAVSVGANWKFTAPSAGVYEVSALLQVTNAGWFAIYKNGSAYKTFGYNPNQGAHAASIRLNAGDYIFITCTSTNTTITGGAIGTNTTGWINIKRVGL